MSTGQRILVATDDSDAADRAVAVAAELAKHLDAELTIVTVEQGKLSENLEEFRLAENATINEILEVRSSEILDRAEASARSVGVSKTRIETGFGDAAAFILNTAERLNPDFIVLGKRGRSRIAGLLIGSVSQKVVTLAHCKVLVVP
jgi:nucleotide-binding universal stress UspA family protein